MSLPSTTQQAEIVALAVERIRSLLKISTTLKIQKYLLRRNSKDFRRFEEEVAATEDFTLIPGTGILATRSEIDIERPRWEEDFFKDSVPLGSHELGAYIGSFPLDAAAASYAFTILEVFGNDVVEIIAPGTVPKHKAWHKDVKGFANMANPADVQKARGDFAKFLGVSASDVSEVAAKRMVKLKFVRNEFAHNGGRGVDFPSYLHDVLAVMCHIVFLTTTEDRISVYPWEDQMDLFEPQT